MGISRTLPRLMLLAVTACALSACFDLDEKVSIGRGGAGRYQVALSAKGAIGEVLKSDKLGNNDMLKPNKAVVTTGTRNGTVTKTATVDFESLSELKLDNEQVGIHVLDHGWFGITSSHVRFRRTFLVGYARAARGKNAKDAEMDKQTMTTVFGDHKSTFSVTLPGSIDRIAPVKIGGVEVKPDVTGDFYNGHTITWRIPFSALLSAGNLTFEVDFNAIGSFADAQSKMVRK